MTTQAATARKSGDVEQAILDAASGLLAERGLQGLSMRLVAERVGVSATAIYHYFDNKDALVRKLVQSGFERFGAYLREAATSCPRGTVERVAAVGDAYLRFAMENQEYFRILFDLARETPPSLDELPAGGGYGFLREAVVEAMDAGAMRRADPDVMVMYLWSITHGLMTISMACRVDRCAEFPHGATGTPAVEYFRAFADFIRNGIAVPPSGGARAAGETHLE